MRMIALSVLIIVCFGQNLFAAKQPNFLIIMADDCTYNDLPLYGGQNAKPPKQAGRYGACCACSKNPLVS